MSLLEKVLAASLVIVGAGVLVSMIAWWWTGRRGPSTGEREAVADAPPTVVAGSDLEWQASLARMNRELDAILAGGSDV